MKYEKNEVIQLLDASTITALLRIYNLKYKHIAGMFNVTRPAVTYMIKHDSFKDWQREKVLEMFQHQGLEIAELMLIHQMVNTSKKVRL